VDPLKRQLSDKERFAAKKALRQELVAKFPGLARTKVNVVETIGPAGNARVAAMAAGSPAPVVTFGGAPGVDFRADAPVVTVEGTAFTCHHAGVAVPVAVPLLGAHTALAALAALAVARHFGSADEDAVAALGRATAVPGRSRPLPGRNGSLLVDANGTVRGSALLAQNFSSDKYFQPRPSAAGTGFDATSSGGTNLGPTSQKLADNIKAAVSAYRTANALKDTDAVPADAVTSSGSGLDPHVSVANAQLQAPRVARARGLALAQIQPLIAQSTAGRDLGVLGEPGVNVLLLNIALDRIPSGK